MEFLKKISVVSILNKGSRFYITSLKSFAYQTYQNTEWLIIDNTGRNLLSTKMEKYLQKDERIRLISNKESLPKLAVLKQVFQEAEGDFIAFLDPQDYWVKDKLARQIGFMMRYHAPLSHTSYAFAGDKCNLLPIGCYHVEKELNMLNYNIQNPVSNSTIIIAKDNILLDFSKFEENEIFDFMMIFLKCGIVSSGLTDVMTLCRPIFEKEIQQKLEDLIKKFLEESPKDTNIPSRILEHHAYSALNIDGLKLDPSICIGYDVIESLTRLKNFKV